MLRGSVFSVLLRIVGVIAGLVLLGIVLKLTGQILTPVLPPTLMQALSLGWSQLYGMVSPAIGPIGAFAILVLLLWIFFGRR